MRIIPKCIENSYSYVKNLDAETRNQYISFLALGTIAIVGSIFYTRATTTYEASIIAFATSGTIAFAVGFFIAFNAASDRQLKSSNT